MEVGKRYAGIILNILIPLFSICFICIAGPKLLRFFMPFVIGWIIAMIANPVVRFLDRRLRIVRKHSSILIIVFVLAMVIGILYWGISKLVIELRGFIAVLPELYENFRVEFHHLDYLYHKLPQNLQEYLNNIHENFGEYLTTGLQGLAFPTVSVAGNLAKQIPTALVYTIITVISSYFFIADRDKWVFFIRKCMPETMNVYLSFLRKDLKRLLGGYFLAQFKIMFVVAVVLVIGFFVLRVDYAIFLAVAVAVLDFLPLFGTGTVLIPWAILKLISGEYFMAAGLALLYILTQVIRQMIQPKIVGDSMGIPPLMTLFLLYLGFKLNGLSGMVLAVPIGIIILNLYHFGMFDSMVLNIKILIETIRDIRDPDGSGTKREE